MFSFSRRNKELDALIRKIQLEAENNYKDAAQEAYQKFCRRLEEMEQEGSLKQKALVSYRQQKNELEKMMKGFHH